MEELVVIGQLLSLSRKKRARRRERLRRIERRRRWQAFMRRQTQLCLMVMLLLCSASLSEKSISVVWVKERSSHWWDQVVLSTFSSSDWLTNFQMSKATFEFLCHRLESSVIKQDTVMRKAVPVDKRVALALWILATGADYRTVGHLFGVSKSTVCVVTKEVCASIVSTLLSEYVKFPTGSSLTDIVDGFYSQHGFPQCVGAVDGPHIPIISPHECPSDYYNRKGFHSVILQGTVDHRGLFTDVYVGWPGRVHDARVFANSSLYRRGQQNNLLPNRSVVLGGSNVSLVLLGDPAYPLLPWLMKAFVNNGRLTSQQKLYNYRLSKARVAVEHAYGRLKGRWRCLLKRLDVDVVDVPELVAACYVLHNICEVKGDGFDEEWIEGIVGGSDVSCSSTHNPAQPTADSVAIRDTFNQHFSQ